MILDAFEALRKEFTDRENLLLTWKREQYAHPDADVLENFATLEAMLGMPRSQVAAVYLAKHLQAILKQVREGSLAWAWEDEHGEGLKQRIADARNYLLLLAACIEEEQQDDT